MAEIVVNSKAFFDTVRATLFNDELGQGHVDGMNAIFARWPAAAGAPQLAYVLATAYHETGRTMQPIREVGRGRGRPYGKADVSGQVAYGRGFVQLTWRANYLKADIALGLRGSLVSHYDLALEPGIAAQILVRGMREGWFTGMQLDRYVNDAKTDFFDARKTINGLDDAALIATYALKFENALGDQK